MAYLHPKEMLMRVNEFLTSAEHAAQEQRFNACAVCSYAASFWTVRAALAHEGFAQPKWEHLELQSNFIQELTQRRSRYPQNFGKWLVNAYDLRNTAQYHVVPPKMKRVRRMFDHSKEFLQIVTEAITS